MLHCSGCSTELYRRLDIAALLTVSKVICLTKAMFTCLHYAGQLLHRHKNHTGSIRLLFTHNNGDFGPISVRGGRTLKPSVTYQKMFILFDSFLHENLSSIVSTYTLRKTVCRLQSPANSLKLFLRANMCGLSEIRIQQHARKLMKSN